ncbi:unnamed protein product [Parnassius apollo]|uniref:(apollo) hypothetical protein n=1 Tax=Parnassius apollo TaxID=110799 RepID=A0A8S3YCT6_PARAO|nr:unnamed protein product [Parnassius apollo]
MLYRIMKNKKKNENISTEEKVEQLVENVNTQKREEIKERLMFVKYFQEVLEKVRDKKENKTAKNENLKEQLILEFLDDKEMTTIAADKKIYN